MMEDLAMHLLELLMNSLEHSAKRIELYIFYSTIKNRIFFKVKDDGEGMVQDFASSATDSFVTTRSTRKIGMGLAFMKSLVDYTNGQYSINSKVNAGTTICFDVQKDHIDLPPLGNIGELAMFALCKNPDISFFLEFKTDDNTFCFDSEKVTEEVGGLSYNDPQIQLWIKDYINEGIESIT